MEGGCKRPPAKLGGIMEAKFSYDDYIKAVEKTKRKLGELYRGIPKWYDDVQRESRHLEHYDGAAAALSAVFGIYDFTVKEDLGISEVRERHEAACKRAYEAAGGTWPEVEREVV